MLAQNVRIYENTMLVIQSNDFYNFLKKGYVPLSSKELFQAIHHRTSKPARVKQCLKQKVNYAIKY